MAVSRRTPKKKKEKKNKTGKKGFKKKPLPREDEKICARLIVLEQRENFQHLNYRNQVSGQKKQRLYAFREGLLKQAERKTKALEGYE